MPFHEASTRVAQPPGGRTSFTFADGSDQRRMPEPRANPMPLSTYCAQPPGGRGSFVFDDTISRGVEANSRHTNGLRRIDPPQAADHSADYRQPPGGRSGFSLTDGSSDPPPQQPMAGRRGPTHFDDSLTDFVADHSRNSSRQPSAPYQQQPPPPQAPHFNMNSYQPQAAPYQAPYQPQQPTYMPAPAPPPPTYQAQLGNNNCDPLGSGMRRMSMAPPGGRSSFSFGWNEDSSGNHHSSYHNISKRHGSGFTATALEQRNGPPAMPPRDGGGYGGYDPTMPAKVLAPQHGGGGGGGGGGSYDGFGGGFGGGFGNGGAPMDGGLHSGRSSSRVNAPPGGHSSFSFG